jgi:ribosomal protein S18 acetylase RimI-like enzyme
MWVKFLPLDFKHTSGGETIHSFKIKIGELYAIVREQCRRFFVREKIFAFEKSLPASSKIEAKVEADVRLAQSIDISKLTEKFGARGMKEGIRKGHLCFIADMDGEILHYKWVAFDEAYVSELKRKIHFDSNSAYIYSSFTVPDYRGFGLDSKVTTKVFDYLNEQGIEKVYILVRHNNFPSQRVIQKVGYRKMGEIRFIQVLSSRKYTCKGPTEKDCKRIKEMLLLH